MTNIIGAILMVVTSCGEMDNGKPTGLWLEECSVPYILFTEAGYSVDIVSPKGGEVPIDARSISEDNLPEGAEVVMPILKSVPKLSSVNPREYDAVFFPGGHGTMFDLPDNEAVQGIVREFVESGRPSAFVCHGPAALVGVMGSDGEPMVTDRRLTGFTNEEEEAVKLIESMPFLLETRLVEEGANYVRVQPFQPHVVVHRNLITGQNPASSKGAAEAVLKQLQKDDE